VIRVTILADYQNAATSMADWSRVSDRAELVVFDDHLADPDDVVKRLADFDAICVMRERTPLPRCVIERPPRLKLIASTGPGNASIDMAAAQERGMKVTNTGYTATPTVELTWALIMAATRNLAAEAASVRAGGWQTSVGRELRGQLLGSLGLGGIGSQIASIAAAFGMEVLAWSQHLTPENAEKHGALWVPKDALFEQADTQTIHLVLSDRTRGLVAADELGRMKSTSWLVKPSRGPIVEEAALIDALRREPSAVQHWTCSTPNRYPPTTRCAPCPTCWPRRTSATSLKTSTAPSTATPPTASPTGSTQWWRRRERQSARDGHGSNRRTPTLEWTVRIEDRNHDRWPDLGPQGLATGTDLPRGPHHRHPPRAHRVHPFTRPDQRMAFDAATDTVAMETHDGEPLKTLHPARGTFHGFLRNSATSHSCARRRVGPESAAPQPDSGRRTAR
jgi:phosphoglycerate dehydrogenase-like enzyme